MNTKFTKEEIRLFDMIAGSLSNSENRNERSDPAMDADPAGVYALAEGHGILPIVYEPLMAALPEEEEKARLNVIFRENMLNFHQLLRSGAQVVDSLLKGGVPTVLLKGPSVARLYPVPEARRSTDIDLLLMNRKDLEKAREILLSNGGRVREKEPGDPNHHEEWDMADGRLMELHVSVIEPFDDPKMNRRIDEIFALTEEDVRTERVMGTSIRFLQDDRMALHLMLHMRMDFLRSGFGLKLLCDWVVFWNREIAKEDLDRFLAWTEELGLSKFLAAVTKVCVSYLGLSENHSVQKLQQKRVSDALAEELLSDVVETERNGVPGADRMVALRGSGFFDYVREFHHQTVLTFPKAAKLIFPLPVLYPVVFFRFLYHAKAGKNPRRVSGIMKSAAERGQMVKNLR